MWERDVLVCLGSYDKIHRLGAYKELTFAPRSCRGWEVRMKVLAHLVSGEAPFPRGLGCALPCSRREGGSSWSPFTGALLLFTRARPHGQITS